MFSGSSRHSQENKRRVMKGTGHCVASMFAHKCITYFCASYLCCVILLKPSKPTYVDLLDATHGPL